MEICEPITASDWDAYYDLRYRILREPWGQERGTERDVSDAQSINRMIVRDGTVIAVCRLHFNTPDEAQIRYMAVETTVQGKGVGLTLMAHMEEIARARGAERIILEARENAVTFYKRQGYVITKESYLLFGVIQHYTMEKFVHA
ncbi:MAG: GNAT family N-acetyltransferase [Candidatus Kapaibacterium sp.]